jgi:hypothetical protein
MPSPIDVYIYIYICQLKGNVYSGSTTHLMKSDDCPMSKATFRDPGKVTNTPCLVSFKTVGIVWTISLYLGLFRSY